ncbi:MAG TPA: hypothetical protein VK726_21715 [Acetobacteraceae bacterium]|jgi:hypothetical protein|nr:hypothetical protein [Acetobacteraceae bacterium]
MDWRLNAMTIVAKGVVMAALVLAGARVVHNVTVAFTSVVTGCGGVVHTASLLH